MNFRTAIILSCLTGIIFASFGYEHSRAEPQGRAALKVGLVRVRKVFRQCQSNISYRQQVLAEYNKAMAELERLSKELQADEAGLKTLKPASPDYLKQYQQILQKRAHLEAQQQYHKQHRALTEQRHTEQLYKQILQITKDVAEKMRLDLVLQDDEPEFPLASADELVMTINTHKVLYSAGCLDITAEVIARLDEEK
ncbi:MAG: OmpH family outer membrane protein [Sedimentisphaerales bacterium]